MRIVIPLITAGAAAIVLAQQADAADVADTASKTARKRGQLARLREIVKGEPTIQEVQRASLAHYQLEPERIDSMSTAETVRIVRAFSYFSPLANIAEDQNNIRQMRAQNSAGDVGTLARTLAHAREAGIQ